MDDVVWLTDAEQQAWRAFLAMRRDLDRAIERQLTAVGISAADFALLVPLSEAPQRRQRVRDLGRTTGWNRSRLSHHVRRMEQRGLVSRHDCDTDARGTVVQLTDAGMAAVQAAAPGHVDTVRRVLLDVLSADELSTLRTISERVSSRLTGACREECASEMQSDDDACGAPPPCQGP